MFKSFACRQFCHRGVSFFPKQAVLDFPAQYKLFMASVLPQVFFRCSNGAPGFSHKVFVASCSAVGALFLPRRRSWILHIVSFPGPPVPSSAVGVFSPPKAQYTKTRSAWRARTEQWEGCRMNPSKCVLLYTGGPGWYTSTLMQTGP